MDSVACASRANRGQQDPALAQWFDGQPSFYKNADVTDEAWQGFQAYPLAQPAFGHYPDEAVAPTLVERVRELEAQIAAKNQHILKLEKLVQQLEAGRIMRVLRRLQQLYK